MKQHKYWLLPLDRLVFGAIFYIYYGVQYNAWMENLPNILIFLVIIIALFWALRKKRQLEDERNNRNSQ